MHSSELSKCCDQSVHGVVVVKNTLKAVQVHSLATNEGWRNGRDEASDLLLFLEKGLAQCWCWASGEVSTTEPGVGLLPCG
jgi:hypothetical protein